MSNHLYLSILQGSEKGLRPCQHDESVGDEEEDRCNRMKEAEQGKGREQGGRKTIEDEGGRRTGGGGIPPSFRTGRSKSRRSARQ